MQAEKFIEILSQPERLDHGSEEQLRQLVEKFPYSQPLRILLAKNLQKLQRPDFEKQVNQAAACATDRRKFQGYISGRGKTPAATTNPTAPNPAVKKEGSSFIPFWILQLFLKKKKPAPTPKPAVLPAISAATPNGSEKAPASGPTEIPAEMPEKKAGSKHQDLIDKFISQEPRIKPRRDAHSHENLADKNQPETLDIATETLAAIFIKQGLHEKAIDIYQKLSLKFPEKSSYFAEKIDHIKNEINLKN